MSKVIKYEHHGRVVSVQEHLKGTHREHCLCYQHCANFKPGHVEHCKKAQLLFELCVKFDMTTPVFECPSYILQPEEADAKTS